MTPFPPIQRLCPHLDRLGEVVDAGFCRMCSREVHDLTAMDARKRAGFLAARRGETCVSYTMNVKPALAAALIAASAAVLAAPDAALAASHQSGRSHHRQRPVHVRAVRVQPIPVLAGMIAPPDADRPPTPAVPPPAVPPSPPQKPD